MSTYLELWLKLTILTFECTVVSSYVSAWDHRVHDILSKHWACS